MKTYLDPQDVVSLENEAGNLRDRLLIRLLFRSGCRVSEVLALSVDDFDMSSRTITINHLKRRIKISCPNCKAYLGQRHVFYPKCGKKVDARLSELREHHRKRMVPVDHDSVALFLEYVAQNGPVSRNGRRLLFGINRHRAWQIITECANRAGLPMLVNSETGKVHHVSPHKLRDAFAINAVKHNDSGDGLRLLQKHLGHQSFNTTARYRKVSGEEQREWYQHLWD
jgi:integrase/recombinase XerD